MLTLWRILAVIITANCIAVSCFWLPPYKVNLHQKEEFVFLSDFAEGDEEEEQELEMVKDDQLHGLMVQPDKMAKLDEHLRRSIEEAVPMVNETREKEDYYSLDIGHNDYIDQLGLNLRKRGLEVQPELGPAVNTHLLINGKEKRTSADDAKATADASYDYDAFKAEYDQGVKDAARSNATFNYTDGDDVPERGFKDGLKYFGDFKRPRNCTREEAKHIGIKAVNCIVHDYSEATTSQEKLTALGKLMRIIRIWLIIYSVPVIFLYCKFGLCCCCCCCDLCSPRELIHKAKRYAALNPPGVLMNSDGTFHTFQATEYETEAYEYLMQYARNM